MGGRELNECIHISRLNKFISKILFLRVNSFSASVRLAFFSEIHLRYP
jgi:hypothetical protein